MKTLYALLLVLAPLPAPAADIEREKRMASEIVDAILDGDALYLALGEEYDKHEFLGIYTEADEPGGGVIIMHGRGYHPDWPETVSPLRVGLVDHGWNTLSIQMPVLDKEAKYNDYVPVFPDAFPRIEKAIDYLKQQGNERIVLVAHSCSVHMVNAWIKSGRFRDVDAVVGIGMGATDYRQPMVDEWQFGGLDVPILDVYGSGDYPAVHRMAVERHRMIRKGGDDRSEQVMVPGADHYFTDRGDELVETVGGWLDRL